MWAKQEIRFYYQFLYLESEVIMIILLILSLPLLWLLALCCFPTMCQMLCRHLVVIRSGFCQLKEGIFIISGLCFLFPRLPLHFGISRSITLLSGSFQRLLFISIVFLSIQRNSKYYGTVPLGWKLRLWIEEIQN